MIANTKKPQQKWYYISMIIQNTINYLGQQLVFGINMERWLFYLFCWVRLSMRFCNCSRDTGLGGSITPPSRELSDSHGLSIAMHVYRIWKSVRKMTKRKRKKLNGWSSVKQKFHFPKAMDDLNCLLSSN